MSIAKNILKLKGELSENVQLVAISKTKPNEAILEAYDVGQRIFGENKIQDLTKKHQELPKDIQWHFIGHLQTNKVKFIASFISLVHAVDSLKLLKILNKEAKKSKRTIQCLLQMHIAEETSKFGLNLAEMKEILNSDFYKELQKDSEPGIEIVGLMGMATNTDNLSQVSAEFKILKENFAEIKAEYFSEKESFKEISTGMSGDYKLAIEQGSSMIRVGSGVFGSRI